MLTILLRVSLLSYAVFDNVYFSFILATLYLCAGRHDALFVVGSLYETVMLRGMQYHPSISRPVCLGLTAKYVNGTSLVGKMCDLLAVVSLKYFLHNVTRTGNKE